MRIPCAFELVCRLNLDLSERCIDATTPLRELQAHRVGADAEARGNLRVGNTPVVHGDQLLDVCVRQSI